jgi:hypothetical protein
MLFYLNVITRKSHDYAFHKSKASLCINLEAAEVGKKAATSPTIELKAWLQATAAPYILFYFHLFSSSSSSFSSSSSPLP